MGRVADDIAEAAQQGTDLILTCLGQAPLSLLVATAFGVPSMGVYLVPSVPTAEFPLPGAAPADDHGATGQPCRRPAADGAGRGRSTPMSSRAWAGGWGSRRAPPRPCGTSGSAPRGGRSASATARPSFPGRPTGRPTWRSSATGGPRPLPAGSPTRSSPPSCPPGRHRSSSVSAAWPSGRVSSSGRWSWMRFGGAGVRGVVQSGWAELYVEGDDVLQVGEVPHEWLFPRMAATVHHAGAGTTGAGLRAGVPSGHRPGHGRSALLGRACPPTSGPDPRRSRSRT